MTTPKCIVIPIESVDARVYYDTHAEIREKPT